jgi:hypothetical protein
VGCGVNLGRWSERDAPGAIEKESVNLMVMAVLVPVVRETEFFIDNLLVRIHLIVEMSLVDRPCAMGV